MSLTLTTVTILSSCLRTCSSTLSSPCTTKVMRDRSGFSVSPTASESMLKPREANVPGGTHVSDEALDRRWQLVPHAAGAREQLLDARTLEERESYRQNVENFLGTLKVPVGLAGPLRVNGLFARGDYYVPLATSEA